jgi:hypothetical protein
MNCLPLVERELQVGLCRRSGAPASLLATPVGMQDITSGVFRSSQARFTGPLVLLAMITALAVVPLLQTGVRESVVVLAIAVVLLPVDCYALHWTGLFQGLAARTSAAVLGTAVFQIRVLPWAGFFIGSRFSFGVATPLSCSSFGS